MSLAPWRRSYIVLYLLLLFLLLLFIIGLPFFLLPNKGQVGRLDTIEH